MNKHVAPRLGERGLKSLSRCVKVCHVCRSPLRGAWIEISHVSFNIPADSGRSPLRGAWIEIYPAGYG